MKTLRNLEVSAALQQGGTGAVASVGNSITLYLDTDYNSEFPDSIEGEIVGISPLACATGYSYDVEYDETDLTGTSYLRPEDVVDQLVLNETQILSGEIAALEEGQTTESIVAKISEASIPLNSFSLEDHTDSILAEGEYAEDVLKRLRRHDNATVGGLLVVPDIYSGTREISLIGKGGDGAGSATLIDTVRVLGKATASEGDIIRIFGRTVFAYKALPNVTPAAIGFAFTEEPVTSGIIGAFWDLATGAGTYVYHDVREWMIEWVFTTGVFVLQAPSAVTIQQTTAIGAGNSVLKTSASENPSGTIPQTAVDRVIEFPFTLVAVDQGTAFSSGAVRVSWSLQAESILA